MSLLSLFMYFLDHLIIFYVSTHVKFVEFWHTHNLHNVEAAHKVVNNKNTFTTTEKADIKVNTSFFTQHQFREKKTIVEGNRSNGKVVR